METILIELQKKSHTKYILSDDYALVHGIQDLFTLELKHIYWAEKSLLKIIPKLINTITSEEISNILKDHLDISRTHVIKLEKVFSLINEKPVALKCEIMAGLISDIERKTNANKKGILRDASIISEVLKIENYEIATYKTLCTFARNLKEKESVKLLHEILNEEKEADEKLFEIMETMMYEIGNSYEIENEQLKF
jgi:ferritin-like metal-binding protein YciE